MKMRHDIRSSASWLLGFFASWLLCSSVFAQDASISGRVLRRGVVPMTHAHVSYRSPAGQPAYGAYTDSLGYYHLSGIPLSVPEPAHFHPAEAAFVANSVGSSRSFYFATAKPLRQVRIYDVLGRRVAAVDLTSLPMDGLWVSSGSWNGITASGTSAANGIYFASVPGEPKLRALKFAHLREGAETSSMPRVTPAVLQALGISSPAERPQRRTLDDVYIVFIEPDSSGPRFIPRVFTRDLHEGDNGTVIDTVWSAMPQSILFVGNSYTYFNGGVDLHLRNLILSANPSYAIACSSVTVGGYTLGDHWQYSPTRSAIQSGRWDVVVLQEQSQRPALEPDSFYFYARLLNTEILRAHSETAFYMTWARQYDPPMIEPLAAAYDSMGRELGALVAPCGRAFQRVHQEDSTFNLYESDGSHPNVYGTYLVCCVFYAALMQDSPVGITYVNDPVITDEQRLFLQTVAWESVSQHPF